MVDRLLTGDGNSYDTRDPSDGSIINSHTHNGAAPIDGVEDADGNFYVRGYDINGQFNQYVQKFDNTLSRLWATQLSRTFDGMASDASVNGVAVAGGDGFVEFVESGGSLRWTYEGSKTYQAVDIGPNGNEVHAVATDGVIEFFGISAGSYSGNTSVDEGTIRDAVYDENGNLYVLNRFNTFAKYDSNYNKLWTGDINNGGLYTRKNANIAVNSGVEYGIAGEGGYAAVYLPDGTEKWEVPLSFNATHCSFGPNNNLYVTGSGPTVAKLSSSDGSILWSVTMDSNATDSQNIVKAFPQYNEFPDAWGPTIVQVTATQIAALADVPVADVLEVLNATQANTAATMELPELLELIDAVDADVAATMGTPELLELIASTQANAQASVLDTTLNVSLSSSPVAAASTMENGLVNLTFAASEQAQASAGMNTLALSDLIDAVQSPAEASVFTGDVGISLNSAQVDSTATVNDTDLFLALTSAQAASEATMFQGDVSPIEFLQAAQYAAQSDVNDTRLDALLDALQPESAAAMNTIESLDEAIGAFQTNVDASMSDVQITLAALDATQIDSVAAQNDADAGFFIEVGSIPTSATAQSEEAEVALALVVTAEPTSAVAVIPVRGRFNPRRVDVSASGEAELNDAELTSGRNNWVSND